MCADNSTTPVQNGRILLADDEARNRRLLRAILVPLECDVIEAADGEEALALAHTARPDVILLDGIMPKLNGFDVCRRLKADPATTHIPVFLVTALQEDSVRQEALDAGADDCLIKPFDGRILTARLRQILNLRRSFLAASEEHHAGA